MAMIWLKYCCYVENNKQTNVTISNCGFLFVSGTDEKAIIDILCYRSNEQRQQLKVLFKTMYGRVSVIVIIDFIYIV